MRVLSSVVALSSLFNQTNNTLPAPPRTLRSYNRSFFESCGPANSHGIHECHKDGSSPQRLERPADVNENCTRAANFLINGNGEHSIVYEDKINGIGIDPGRGKKVEIGLSDLVENMLHRDPKNKPFVLFFTGADKITLVKDQDFIARSVVRQDEKNVQLIIDGSGVNLGNQWPESGKCRNVYPVIDHDPNYPLFDLMSISPGEVCKFTRAVLSTMEHELVATIPNSAIGDADIGAHLVIMVDNNDMRPGFDTHAAITYDRDMLLKVEFNKASSVPFEALSFDANLPNSLAKKLPKECVQNASSYSNRPSAMPTPSSPQPPTLLSISPTPSSSQPPTLLSIAPTPSSNASANRPAVISSSSNKKIKLKTVLLPTIFGGSALLVTLALTKKIVRERLVSMASRCGKSGSNENSEIEMTLLNPLTESLI